VAPSAWVNVLSEIALAVAQSKSVAAPSGTPNLPVSPAAQAIADGLISGSASAVLLGSAALSHPQSTNITVLAQFIAAHTGATFGFLPVGGNAVGAALVKANGPGVQALLSGNQRAMLLMNLEPDMDLPHPQQARAALAKAHTVIALSAYQSPDLLEVADVILPITPFTETVGTYVNAEGRAQTIQPAVKPLGSSRPAWKVLRVLGELLGLNGFLFNAPEEILGEALSENFTTQLSNQATTNSLAHDDTFIAAGLERLSDEAIYGSDQIVRRAPALQVTRDAKRNNQVGLGQVLFTELNLQEGDTVLVTQDTQSVELPATLEKHLASGVVRLSVGTRAGAKLGSMFGSVTVSKVVVREASIA